MPPVGGETGQQCSHYSFNSSLNSRFDFLKLLSYIFHAASCSLLPEANFANVVVKDIPLTAVLGKQEGLESFSVLARRSLGQAAWLALFCLNVN